VLDRRESVQIHGNTTEYNDLSRKAIFGQRVAKMGAAES